MNKQLIEDYKNGKILLFVGAGVSANLGLPTWSSLINRLAQELGYDPEVFKTYGDYLALAEYYTINKGIGSLRSWMDREWHNPNIDISKSEIHNCISKGNFPIVYTTNYDNWIELSYKCNKVNHNKIVNVNDISNGSQNCREIVKFHGDFSNDDSIVLSETSYYKRLQFETPLDIKLRSDTLGKAVLFIGYSLQDINTRYLFYKLSNLWENYGGGFAKPQSYIFSAKSNPIQEAVLEKWGIRTLTSSIDDPGMALVDFLNKLINA